MCVATSFYQRPASRVYFFCYFQFAQFIIPYQAFYRFFALRQPSEGSKATHYYGIIAIFILSAALGSITTEHFGNYAILFCVIPLCACLWILAQNRDTLR